MGNNAGQQTLYNISAVKQEIALSLQDLIHNQQHVVKRRIKVETKC